MNNNGYLTEMKKIKPMDGEMGPSEEQCEKLTRAQRINARKYDKEKSEHSGNPRRTTRWESCPEDEDYQAWKRGELDA